MCISYSYFLYFLILHYILYIFPLWNFPKCTETYNLVNIYEFDGLFQFGITLLFQHLNNMTDIEILWIDQGYAVMYIDEPSKYF